MTTRLCWTCNTEHDLDAACPASPVVRQMRSVGTPGNTLADHTTPDLFDDPDDIGPVFPANLYGEDECCGDGIEPGQSIRAFAGGWIHASAECERMVRG